MTEDLNRSRVDLSPIRRVRPAPIGCLAAVVIPAHLVMVLAVGVWRFFFGGRR